jgi:hypothetical protein
VRWRPSVRSAQTRTVGWWTWRMPTGRTMEVRKGRGGRAPGKRAGGHTLLCSRNGVLVDAGKQGVVRHEWGMLCCGVLCCVPMAASAWGGGLINNGCCDQASYEDGDGSSNYVLSIFPACVQLRRAVWSRQSMPCSRSASAQSHQQLTNTQKSAYWWRKRRAICVRQRSVYANHHSWSGFPLAPVLGLSYCQGVAAFAWHSCFNKHRGSGVLST